MNYSKLLITGLLACLFACKTTAPDGLATADRTATEPQNALSGEKTYRLAQCYLNGINTDVDYPKALAHFSSLARQGDPRGLNGVAGMYRQGLGVEQDPAKARELYRQASEMGEGKASYNLAMMYKTAQGGEQDFGKAFEYAQTALEQGNQSALYMLGYFYYKGFGAKQDYAQAVRHFRQGVENNQTSSMYFLGLCYLGGYGVEKDIARGKALIKRAAELGHDHAVEFISEGSLGKYTQPENKDSQGKTYPPFRQATGFPVRNLSGEWQGRMLQYDYSGRRVMEEHSLHLSISDRDGTLSGYWLQSDSVAMVLNATRNGSAFQAENMQYIKTWDRTYEIRTLHFALLAEQNGDTVLYAVVEQFSPQTVEPAAPTMLELRRAGGGAINRAPTELRVYPNPFSDRLTVEFTAPQAGEYAVALYDLSGKPVRTETVSVGVEYFRPENGETVSTPNRAKDISPLRQQIKTLDTSGLPVGTYSVNLRGEGVNISTLVIKNKN